MPKYRVITNYTAYIGTDIIADSKEKAIEQVRNSKEPIDQDCLRDKLDDIEESWTEHRTAFEL